MTTVICNTKFKLDSFADGGSKRSVQIRQLYEKNGFVFKEDSFAISKERSFCFLLANILRAIAFICKFHLDKISSISEYIKLIKYYALRIPVIYDKYINQDIVFSWENTTDRNLLYLMKATQKKVIAFPHNLESIVRNRSIESLKKEIDNLKYCDVVFAISKEETWLLRNLGLNAYYLPYYPPVEVVKYLLAIKNQKQIQNNSNRKRFLLLGSATNTPTRDGMQAIIDYASTKDFNFSISVAGYGTDSLTKVNHSNINFLGALTQIELANILLNTDAVLVYQPPTTGSLTRIPEMLMAGIPVFVNFDAARDYHNVEDVLLYESFDSLFDKLTKFVPHCACSLQQNFDVEDECVSVIKSFL